MSASVFARRAVVLGPVFLLAAAAAMVAVSSGAQAISVSVDAGGSSWSVTATATVNSQGVRRGAEETGTTKNTYSAYALGIPLPVTGYYVNSFQSQFNQPIVYASNGQLSSRTYSKKTDAYLGATQWMVNGSNDFWGSQTTTITGKATAGRTGGGYFHAGTGTGHDTDANAILYVRVS